MGISDRGARSAYQGQTILAEDRMLGTDTWQTGLNNNVLVIGPSGSGKTRHHVKPNLLQMGSSFVVLDTKGVLCREVGPVLAAHGYRVQRLNFADLSEAGSGSIACAEEVGYNPLAFIRRDPATGRPNQQDIISVASALCPVEDFQEPFWDHCAANYIAAYIAYTLEQLPEEEQTLESVVRLTEGMYDRTTDVLLDELEVTDPRGFACQLYRRTRATEGADRMHASILGILAEKEMALGFDSAIRMYRNPAQVDFAAMGHERTALFVTVSDIDHSLAPLTSLFVSQAFQALIREADACPGGALPVPVRLVLDDFANLQIPGFDDVLSVIRSREIWCTVLIQALSQLDARYGSARAMSIVGNCDAQVVLAFQDPQTAGHYADRADKRTATLLTTPPGRSWLFLRGRMAELVDDYDIVEHPLYSELPEARAPRLDAASCSAHAESLGL